MFHHRRKTNGLYFDLAFLFLLRTFLNCFFACYYDNNDLLMLFRYHLIINITMCIEHFDPVTIKSSAFHSPIGLGLQYHVTHLCDLTVVPEEMVGVPLCRPQGDPCNSYRAISVCTRLVNQPLLPSLTTGED